MTSGLLIFIKGLSLHTFGLFYGRKELLWENARKRATETEQERKKETWMPAVRL